MQPFYSAFPELAQRETRVAIVPVTQGNTPAGRYAFMEFFCSDRGCDCRRALIEVVEESNHNTILATINFGWESANFYAQRLGGDQESAAEIRAASLDPLNAQSDLAESLLALFRQIVRSDQAYVDRLARHYQMFKQATTPPPSNPPKTATPRPAAPRIPSASPPTAPNLDKIDDAVLALLYLTSFTEGKGEFAFTCAWKGHDWDALNRLHEKGFIGDPVSKAKSVALSPEGQQRAEALFRQLFCD